MDVGLRLHPVFAMVSDLIFLSFFFSTNRTKTREDVFHVIDVGVVVDTLDRNVLVIDFLCYGSFQIQESDSRWR